MSAQLHHSAGLVWVSTNYIDWKGWLTQKISLSCLERTQRYKQIHPLIFKAGIELTKNTNTSIPAKQFQLHKLQPNIDIKYFTPCLWLAVILKSIYVFEFLYTSVFHKCIPYMNSIFFTLTSIMILVSRHPIISHPEAVSFCVRVCVHVRVCVRVHVRVCVCV